MIFGSDGCDRMQISSSHRELVTPSNPGEQASSPRFCPPWSHPSFSSSMSQSTPVVPASVSQEPPIYTECAPLIWLDLTVQGRWLEVSRRCRLAQEAVPITPHLYASLHKVSCLVASRISEPEGQRQLSECFSKWDGISGLLLYTTTLMIKIYSGTSPTFRIQANGI